ncbi:hypothetical protein [Kiloniella litopenaei]|uniref:hypothetical protein n=1 Tax=Kiloniella litopenaei TaxID=1549748 RepID=UPI003BAD0A3D
MRQLAALRLIYRALFLFPLYLSFAPLIVNADTFALRMDDRQEGTSQYYHELLTSALALNGHSLKVINKGDLPQKRLVIMFEKGDLDIIWLLKSKERNEKYININVDLTNGMMGQRVLFIPPYAINEYAHIKTIEDFRKSQKVGVFGANWFDEQVWKENNLPYRIIDGDWGSIYNRLLHIKPEMTDRLFHYFSRSVTEIVQEAKHHPQLAIEPHLLFKYDRDFHFYILKENEHLKPILEQALSKAKETGLIDKLIKKHFAEQLKSLNLENRVLLQLTTPQ